MRESRLPMENGLGLFGSGPRLLSTRGDRLMLDLLAHRPDMYRFLMPQLGYIFNLWVHWNGFESHLYMNHLSSCLLELHEFALRIESSLTMNQTSL